MKAVISALDRYYWAVAVTVPSFWVEHFISMQDVVAKSSRAQSAAPLLQAGRMALDRQNLEELKQICGALGSYFRARSKPRAVCRILASASDARALAPGQVINGTYTIEQFLGSGAYGDGYRVKHRFLGTQAMKLLRKDPLLPDSSELLGEARVLIDLLHPNIVRVYDANEAVIGRDQIAYITMEYLPAGTLGSLRASTVRLAPKDALEVAAQLLSALGYAHSLNPPVLHRDITPNNVLISGVSPAILVKLGDFGLAGRVHPDTRILRAAGTIHYLPPEAAWGFASEKGDVYAVALLLYELLTGASAYPSTSVRADSTAVQLREGLLASKKFLPPPPSHFRMDLPSRIDALVLRALAPTPADRFPTARDFQQAIVDVSG